MASKRNDHRQQAERELVELVIDLDEADVQRDPDAEPDDVDVDESHRAGDRR